MLKKFSLWFVFLLIVGMSYGQSDSVSYQAGDRKVVTARGVDYAFRYCPPGTFLMGSVPGEVGRDLHEIQHEVTLTKGFWILETEVNQEMWESIMGYNPSLLKDPTFPVDWIRRDEALLFCEKFSKESGLSAALPTEAQWEYACRAGTTTPYAGDDPDAMTWHLNNADWRFKSVASKEANPWGIYDMHGNVQEFCSDKYSLLTSQAQTDPTGPEESIGYVARGGGAIDNPLSCRSASRLWVWPESRDYTLGFRFISPAE